MSHLPLWYLVEVPANVCDEALGNFLDLKTLDAGMGINAERQDHDHRNTDVSFAPEGHWLGKILFDVGTFANNSCGWNFDLTQHERVQYAEYGLDQHYDWHIDTFLFSGTATDRKVTVVCLLNDPSEYEGGEFQVRFNSEYTAPLKKGSIICFPSLLEHRVKPVLDGVRKTATLWISGPSFK